MQTFTASVQYLWAGPTRQNTVSKAGPGAGGEWGYIRTEEAESGGRAVLVFPSRGGSG